MATSLGNDTGYDIAGLDDLHLVFAHHPGNVAVLGLLQLSGDVIRLAAAVGVIDDCQHRLDDFGICLFTLAGAEHDDGFGVVERDQVKISDLKRVAGAADDLHPAGAFYTAADLVFHLHFVFLGEDHHRGFG
ncbi:hypothetical protein SDC9_94330 [bioreactor metagenome]|uniref:Uncharacterized protein n=1 Tax=bioreactor metagenome TaxID=1076179 RepID=A0A645A355_9ZZZZ